jgi:two-component system, cell cycle response regulator
VSERIVVADADPFNLRLLQEVCGAEGRQVLGATTGEEVLDVVAREAPDLIVLDAALPQMDGFEVLRVLKGEGRLAAVPVLLAVPAEDVAGLQRALELGAEDYLRRPYLSFEVRLRVRRALRAARHGAEPGPGARWGEAQQLLISLDYEVTRAARYGHPLSCLVVRGGEASAGDGALIERLRGALRATDQVYAAGVNDVGVLLPETGAEGAAVVMERMRGLLAESVGAPAPVGLAVYPDDGVEDGAGLLDLARRRAATGR